MFPLGEIVRPFHISPAIEFLYSVQPERKFSFSDRAVVTTINHVLVHREEVGHDVHRKLEGTEILSKLIIDEVQHSRSLWAFGGLLSLIAVVPGMAIRSRIEM
ncbi:MAG: hypothetical protein M3457_04015 [Chloroflexota bacterium]|nr:hypothetical protein [Chloroflexota bacterium]